MPEKFSKIYLSSPHMGDHEQQYVAEAFATNWIAPLGSHVDGFEADLQSWTGMPHAAALTSGTAALHLGLILLGVGPGDFVICQSLTFSASANPIRYLGATPVFIDSEPDTWNMCPDALRSAIVDIHTRYPGKKIKAIIPVHLYGMPAQMKEIQSVADEYGIPILEDAAEALGSSYQDRPCGSLGDLGVLSFNGNKIITTSGGGALLGRDESLIRKARFLATQARDPAPHYQHSEIGYNYRMSNILAGIGRGQMRVLQDRVEARRSVFQRYVDFFSEWNRKGFAIRFQTEPDDSYSNRWLTGILVDPLENHGFTSEDIRLALEAANIEARPLWKPMHLQPVFADTLYFGGGVAERLFDIGLCLPSGSNLTEADLGRIFIEFDNVFQGVLG